MSGEERTHTFVHRLEDPAAVARLAAEIVVNRLAARPQVHMLLPTGHTPLPLYAALRERHAAGQVPPGVGRVLQLDEYCGLPRDDEHSYRAYLEHELSGTGLELAEAFDAQAPDLEREARRYQDALAGHEIDLAVLGIGRNGHVAFNEPGAAPLSATRLVELLPSTRLAAVADFGSLERVPTHALSVGLQTLLGARELLLLATGDVKAPALRAMLTGPPRAAVPASLLRMHPRLTVICDRAAAAELPYEPGRDSDRVLVVLGHRDPDSRAHRASHQSFGRLAVAARVARAEPVKAVILTGYTSAGGLSEAEQMAEEWSVQQVPALLEVAGTDTPGNAERSLPLIAALDDVREVTVVTSAWHIRARPYFAFYRSAGYRLRFRYDWRHGPWLRMLANELRLMPPRRGRRSDRRSVRRRRLA